MGLEFSWDSLLKEKPRSQRRLAANPSPPTATKMRADAQRKESAAYHRKSIYSKRRMCANIKPQLEKNLSRKPI